MGRTGSIAIVAQPAPIGQCLAHSARLQMTTSQRALKPGERSTAGKLSQCQEGVDLSDDIGQRSLFHTAKGHPRHHVCRYGMGPLGMGIELGGMTDQLRRIALGPI